MDQITTDVRTQSWASIVTECNRSALSKQEWCRQNNVSIKSFYYWQRKLRREAVQHSGFAEVTVDPQFFDTTPGQTAAVVTVPGLHIEIMNTVNEDFLRKLVRALKDA